MASTQSPGKTYNLELAAPATATATAAVGGGSVQFIGTATTLIRYGNLTIMTDPNFLHKGDHVHLGYGLTATRVTNPAIEFEELPEVDFVVLSHMHDDHFDKFVQEHLDKSMPIITCMEASRKLEKIGFTATIGLNTWDRVDVQKGNVKVRVTSAPGKHGLYGGQMILPSVMGSVLDFGANADAPDYRLYISGDTLIYDDLKTIPQRFPGIDLALLHLGGTRILGVFKVTMDGDDGVQMLKILHPEKAIPIHYNDYDAFKSPLQDFIDAVKAAGLEDKVHYLNHGETYDFTARQRERRTV